MQTIVLDKPIAVTPSYLLVTFDYDGQGNNLMSGRFFGVKINGEEKFIKVHYELLKGRRVSNRYDDMNFGVIYDAKLEDGTECLVYEREKYIAIPYAKGRISHPKKSYSLLPKEQSEKYVSDEGVDSSIKILKLQSMCFG